MDNLRNRLLRDLSIVGLSVIVAVILAKSAALEEFFTTASEWRAISALVAGALWVSVFTAAPATVALAELAQANSLFLVALFGGLGALFGDWLIFRFIKYNLAEGFIHLFHLIKKPEHEKWLAFLPRKYLRWLAPVLGIVIIASPLPDELGLLLMGLSKIKTSVFIPLSFALNFLGILAVGTVARSLL